MLRIDYHFLKMRILTFFLLLLISGFTDTLKAPFPISPPQSPKILAGESFTLRMSGVPTEDINSISGNYTVSPKGEVTLPKLTSPIKAAGQTSDELSRIIEQAYLREKIYEHPTVNIGPHGFVPGQKVIPVVGELQFPGNVLWRADLTLLTAIKERGGVRKSAKGPKVKLLRGMKLLEYDLGSLTKETDPVLEATDQVVVRGLPEASTAAFLQPGQGFSMRVRGVSVEYLNLFSGDYTVSADGTIRLPYVEGVLNVTNKSEADVLAIITKKLREMERFKNIEVSLARASPRFVYTVFSGGGEAQPPQEFAFRPGVRLFAALAMYRGPTAFSDLKKVKLIRGKTETIYDLKKLTKETSPLLEPGDTIVLPGG